MVTIVALQVPLHVAVFRKEIPVRSGLCPLLIRATIVYIMRIINLFTSGLYSARPHLVDPLGKK
jgi:hypothetical protein